jgi:hypothetical protein
MSYRSVLKKSNPSEPSRPRRPAKVNTILLVSAQYFLMLDKPSAPRARTALQALTWLNTEARKLQLTATLDRRSVSVVFREEILIQTFELDCPTGADSNPMLNHEVRQVLPIEQDDTLG